MAGKKKSLAERFQLNLVALRKQAKKSQQAIAEACELSVSYISMLERGQRTPPLDTLELIAKALRVDPVSLLAEPAPA
jgi:transcriptional regulator with XRE-family HTH domain